jgi:putative ABC transport system permease protein
VLLDLRDATAADAVAARIAATGSDAVTTKALLAQQYRADQSIPAVVAVLMQVGLLVGIAGLGIVALRTTTERRHVIGVLRAIGYRRRDVVAGLLAESATVATVGIAVGVVAGIALGYAFWRQDPGPAAFGVDVAGLSRIVALLYAAVLAVSSGPAFRGSLLPPAEAARVPE